MILDFETFGPVFLTEKVLANKKMNNIANTLGIDLYSLHLESKTVT